MTTRRLTLQVKRRMQNMSRRCPFGAGLAILSLGVGLALCACAASPLQVSGIYPHLAFFNDGAECGTGAVVPWADRLWAVTYSPHEPRGSSDKLYEITPDLRLIIRPESIGGTPANRMIHPESQQLFIGPYAIDAQRHVRVIPYEKMFGRPTGNARHLTDPANRIYCASMEEALYEVDVHTLAVTELWADEQVSAGRHSDLPGYHGKGLYSGQGRMIYANNGEHGKEAQRRPELPSGCLAEWDGKAEQWTVVRRNQFTDVAGPGGISGNPAPATDPVWSIGWDYRSLILMLREAGEWHAYRLPKASHCYDGAHGWHTEWPRIRDIGERDLLMTMHGMFWRFPKTFSLAHSAGIAPHSTYLKVVADFCRWNDRVVFGCDDAAKNEFSNRRKAKGALAGPGQSQSNLWFVDPSALDDFGIPLGRGAVWLDEPVRAKSPSEPMLFDGFARRSVHLAHTAAQSVAFRFEVDRRGNGRWTPLREVVVPAGGAHWIAFGTSERGAWVRVRADRDCPKATALFCFSNADRRGTRADRRFQGLAEASDTTASGGLLHARGGDARTLSFAAMRAQPGVTQEAGLYELDGELKLRRTVDLPRTAWLRQNAAIPRGVLTVDTASVLFVDDAGKRWRLPKGDAAFDQWSPLSDARVDREVCTERDLFNAHGTFYELPAETAGGFARIRPVATHNRRIHDYCSYRGLLVMSGISGAAPPSTHIIRSDDGQAALWVGALDDLWKLGKPRGTGGPWHNSVVKAGEPSDPYLMTGYDRKRVQLAHVSGEPVRMRMEVDISGAGTWVVYQEFDLRPGHPTQYVLPEGFSAYWVRLVASADTTATAQFTYE
jgi:hypothetical protein